MTYPPQNSGVPMPYPYGAVHPYPARPLKSSGAAVALELVPGIFGIFGIGNIYAGRVGAGIALMLSFWALFWVNVLLVFLVIGWITAPLTWIAFMIVGAVSAARGAERHNAGH